MPTYSFQCLVCHLEYEDIVDYDESGKYKSVQCPECSSLKKTRLLSTGNFMFTEPEGTSRWISDAKGHDYRFHHKQKDVRKERAMAEAMSKMGKSPYSDMNSDVTSGKYFGEVK